MVVPQDIDQFFSDNEKGHAKPQEITLSRQIRSGGFSLKQDNFISHKLKCLMNFHMQALLVCLEFCTFVACLSCYPPTKSDGYPCVRPSVLTFCLSGTISQYLLVRSRFILGTNEKYRGLSISSSTPMLIQGQ